MAPTTMPKQVTTTTPGGRDTGLTGMPLRMAEMLATLETPAYIVRVCVALPKYVIEAKKAIKKAFRFQKEGRCFSFVEVLSTCPTNWGLTPEEAIKWLEINMIPYYPLREFKVPQEA